jgi:hypothetical protein
MDSAIILEDIVCKPRKKGHTPYLSVHLSSPSILEKFLEQGNAFANVTERLLDHILAISHPAHCVRVAISDMKRKVDLEKFLSISPHNWLRLSFESQAAIGLERGAKEILEDLGYNCSEWVGIEESESQLGAFRFGAKGSLALVLFVQNHGARRNCDLLFPITASPLT